MKFSEIKPGGIYSFERVLTTGDIRAFAQLSGDFNPLHTDAHYAKGASFKTNIAHGMLLAGLFSRLIGMYCPARGSLYLSQSLEFRNPVFPKEKLLVKGTVIDASESTRVVTIKTEIFSNGKLVVAGEAKVLFREED